MPAADAAKDAGNDAATGTAQDAAQAPPLVVADLPRWLPELSAEALGRLERLVALLTDWNARLNLVSRADAAHLVERHVLHSLLITRALRLEPGARVLDVGTGGGFPGLPLACVHPEAEFTLLDSTAKKIAAVGEMAQALGLSRVTARWARAEALYDELGGQFDFVTGRAVAVLPTFWPLVRPFVHCRSRHTLPNGLLYLKGGDLVPELQPLRRVRATVWDLQPWAADRPFFETKRLVHLSDCGL